MLIALMILFCLCPCLLLLLLGVAQGFEIEICLMKSARTPSTHSASKEPQDQIHNMEGSVKGDNVATKETHHSYRFMKR